MTWLGYGLAIVLAVAVQETTWAQEPSSPDSSPDRTSATTSSTAAVPSTSATAERPAPPLIAVPTSSSGFRRPEQPAYGPWVEPMPAQNLAMLEAGRPVSATDPLVAASAVLLTRLTARYVEDAPRIAEETARLVQQIRAANREASPFKILSGAIDWLGPSDRLGNVPREFRRFAELYRKHRIDEAKDHDTALSVTHPSDSSRAVMMPSRSSPAGTLTTARQRHITGLTARVQRDRVAAFQRDPVKPRS